MDAESSTISAAPYCVIRTEKDKIHSVCVGSTINSLILLHRENQASIANHDDDDPEAAFEALNSKTKSNTSTSQPRLSGLGGLGKPVNVISSPIGSKGIFDSSSDDEAPIKSPIDSKSELNSRESLFEATTSGLSGLRLIAPVSSPSPFESRIIIAGCANGTICVFESETGRLLDRIEGAHGMNSVLTVEELRVDSSGLYFGSQGRDGYVRFWSLRIEKGSTLFPTLPELAVRGERFTLRPHSSPVFVGGEAFCKATFNKTDGLIATVAERGSIAVWDYQTVLNLVAKGSVDFRPKCIITYEGEKYGMAMSLQLLESSEKREAALVVGFEDGSVLVWSLAEVADTSPSGASTTSLLYTLAATARPFATTPVLAISLVRASELLQHQTLSPASAAMDSNIPSLDLTSSQDMWIGIATSAEDGIVTFCYAWDFSDSTESIPSGTVKLLETYKMPHQGYGDVKIRSDSLVAIAGWDHRIRLLLLEASGDNLSIVTFQLRSLAILHHHTASVHTIGLGDEETKLLVSGSKDERIALWRVY